MKLVRCEIAREQDVYIKCFGCSAKLKDTEGTKKNDESVVFLCPKCHRFFNEKGIIPYEKADEMFPGESNISY